MINKIAAFLDKILDVTVVVICLLLLGVGVYSLLDNLWLYENAQDKSLLVYKPDLSKPLPEDKKITEDQVAWLCVDGTSIDYPVMQGKDNIKYLNTDPYGSFALSGSIFLDYRCSSDFSDDYSLVYGHHLEHNVMFGALDAFADKTYFDEHRTGSLVTSTEVYKINIFAATAADTTDELLFQPSGQSISQVTAYLRSHADIYTAPEPNKNILALSTCAGVNDTSRFLVFGTLTEK